jgi:hypothetical protein
MHAYVHKRVYYTYVHTNIQVLEIMERHSNI